MVASAQGHTINNKGGKKEISLIIQPAQVSFAFQENLGAERGLW